MSGAQVLCEPVPHPLSYDLIGLGYHELTQSFEAGHSALPGKAHRFTLCVSHAVPLACSQCFIAWRL